MSAVGVLFMFIWTQFQFSLEKQGQLFKPRAELIDVSDTNIYFVVGSALMSLYPDSRIARIAQQFYKRISSWSTQIFTDTYNLPHFAG